MGYLNTETTSRRVNAAFKERKTLTMEEIIEDIMTDPKALEEAMRYNGSDGSVEGARLQTEMGVECVFEILFENELIEPVRAEDNTTISGFWNPDDDYPIDDPDCYRGGLHPIEWTAKSDDLPVIDGVDL